MKINLSKVQGKLIPAMDEDKEKLVKYFEEGEVVEVSIKTSRNYKFLKKYWSLVNLVFENLPENFCLIVSDQYYIPIPTAQELHYQIKVKAGLYKKKTTWGGFQTIEVKSIAFDKMEEHEFSEFYDKVFDIVLAHFLVDSKREEIEPMLAGYY